MSKKPTLRVVDDAGLWIAGPDPLADDYGLAKKPAPPEEEDRFVQISLRGAVEVFKKLGNTDCLILVMLAYEAFRAKGPTFLMSNNFLALYGVNRETKRRTLARFERAGVIRVERRQGKAPIVTLLVKFNR
jgi:hypothetical protein